VSRSATSRILLAAFLVSALSALLLAEDGAVSSRSPADISTIVIGFTGGFVRHDNPYHGPVRLAKRIQNNLPHGTYVRVFENRHRKSAYNAILRLLDRDHDGVLTGEEKAQAHIVLFGHSWGASAVVLLARELDRIGIPVLLTVQVDSVAKLWQSDGIIPDNVAAAVNFYQPHGFIHGRSLIRAADTSKTQILGNYRYDYNQAPVKCEGASWFDRAFMASHIESECDPHLWSRVEDLVRQRLQPELGFVAAVPQP
jgi:pimeloyl-ACP methyl ester carboxylesterase